MALHANWHNSALYVWGLDDSGDAPLAAEKVRAAVADLSADALVASVAAPAELTLWLPRDGRLAATVVPALRLGPAEAVDLLVACPCDEAAAADPAAGDSVRYWAALARFVVDLVARQQFYPDLDDSGPEPGAVWRLLVGGPDALDRLERFAGAMPPSCRAVVPDREDTGAAARLSSPKSGAAAAPDPGRLVESFVSTTADATIRRDVSHDPFFTRVHDLAKQPDAAPDVRWLSALLGTDRAIAGDPYDNRWLADQVRGWVGKLDETLADAAWRVQFVLEEPDEDDDIAEPEAGAVVTPAGVADDDVTPSADRDLAVPEPHEDEAAGSAVGGKNATGADASWRVRIRLRPPEGIDAEPIDAADLWEERGASEALLGRRLAERRAQVQADVARAADVFPPLRPVAQAGGPAPPLVEIATPEANLFIRQWSVQLREQGFEVTLPEWAARRESAPGLLLSLRPLGDDAGPDWDADGDDEPRLEGGSAGARRGLRADVSGGRFGLDTLLAFDWQVAIGDLRLSPEEFRSLATRGVPLVRHRGRWVQLDADAAAKAAAFLQDNAGGEMTLADAFRTAFGAAAATGAGATAGATNGAAGVPILGLSGTSWVKDLLEQTPAARAEEIAQPSGFAGTLRPYQLRGLQWLSFLARLGIGGCLADDMGLGKTIQLIALLLHERERAERVAAQGGGGNGNGRGNGKDAKRRIGPTLLFAPTSVVGNWAKELAKFGTSLKVLVHHGPERLHGEDFRRAAEGSDVAITSYALAHRDLDDLKRVHWHRVALDEAQKIKNPYAASTQAIRSLSAPHRVALTGTPIENRLSELWSIMEVLNPGLLGTASEFRDRFAVPIEKLVDQDRAGQLRRLIQPFVLRRTKQDPQVAADLPEKMEMRVYCNLTPEQAAMYQSITSEMLGQVDAADGIRRRALVLAALTRLKQVCDHPELLLKGHDKLDGRSGKAERLVEMLEEVLEEGDRALVFTQFREMGHLLEKQLSERLHTPIQFLHGGTPPKQRDAMVERFQAENSDVKIFLLSLRAGGLGLNLTAANHVFHYDRWWNPAVESQATDRAHRIGQTRKVQVHKFVCMGTVEERIDQLLSDKLALADRIVGSGDEWLTSLSTDELRKTLELNESAVAEY